MESQYPQLWQNVAQSWGDRGLAWLDELPEAIDRSCARWKLESLHAFPDLSYRFVASAIFEGQPVVLKLGVPDAEFALEVRALKALAEGGGPAVLREDLREGVVLMERILPGETIQSRWTLATDREQTATIAGLWSKLHQQARPEFPTVMDWRKALETLPPQPYFARAIEISETLAQPLSGSKLLHGDLHHGNVLTAGSGHRAIDPKGVVGPPAFEVYALLHNPLHAAPSELVDLLPKRIDTVSDVTGIPRQELVEWGYIGMAISAAWDCEGGGEPSAGSVAVLSALGAMLP